MRVDEKAPHSSRDKYQLSGTRRLQDSLLPGFRPLVSLQKMLMAHRQCAVQGWDVCGFRWPLAAVPSVS